MFDCVLVCNRIRSKHLMSFRGSNQCARSSTRHCSQTDVRSSHLVLWRAMIRRAGLHVPHEVFQEESDTHIDDITVIVIRTRNVEKKLWKQPVGQHVAG